MGIHLVERATYGQAAAVEDMGVDHSGLDVAMAEEVLDCSYVVAVLEEVSGEGMAEGMATDAFGDAGVEGGEADGLLEGAAAGVMPAAEAGARIGRDLSGGEHILPGPFASSARVFPLESFGEVDVADAGGQVLIVEDADLGDVALEGLDEGLGEDRDPVAPGFGIPD
jgi:hypothetical protein